ncbi:phospholipase D family nuclease [Noviherbaspirillum autotrophicum]|uniref:phospholipase D n=1 Tax=Noviherbaspirillum autotrophicum TaxID=709839 RepID=A0A0C2BGV3_9BURK|nr:phospholipase D family protein [Noviherbaspirillum autotrophicum]KIF80470.1 endonuclease [Noviherbaspirillum autotrophicum]
MIVRARAVFGALVLSAAFGALAEDAPLAAHGTLQAAFAPWDNVEELVAETIRDARRQVLVQAYLLTSKTITMTLVAACRRGVDVRVMLDAQQLGKTASSAASDLDACGIPVWLETKYQNAHNKVIVVDVDTPDATVVTGSFNFTWTAQHKNAENILIVRKNPALAARYAANWERHRQDATPYQK